LDLRTSLVSPYILPFSTRFVENNCYCPTVGVLYGSSCFAGNFLFSRCFFKHKKYVVLRKLLFGVADKRCFLPGSS
jgi:hypothetical protein